MKKVFSRIVTGIMILLLLACTACRSNDTQRATSSSEEMSASIESMKEPVSVDDNDENRGESHKDETSTDNRDWNDKVEEETEAAKTEEGKDSTETKASEREEIKVPADTKVPEKEETKNPAETEKPEENESVLMPWEKPGAKQPSEYTAAEFEALTSIQKQAFVASFDSVDDFNAWMERVTGNGGTAGTEQMPWENAGAKQPEEYTWDEYEALTALQKEAFFDSFDSSDDFNKWLNRVTGNGDSTDSTETELMPWENGGKQPEEYTWDEYEALTAVQKEAFFDSFDNADEFDKWMDRVTGNSGPADSTETEQMPWENGGKQPEEYTWDEYEALTPAQKEAFFDSFDSADDFDKWVNRVTGNGGSADSTETEKMPWENGGKQPEEYTWDEYEALTPAQKEAFFDSFDSADDFDEWMNRAKENSDTAEIENMPWENGGKQPEEYTWEEYEALTPAQKEAFFESFEDTDAFDAWLKANQP